MNKKEILLGNEAIIKGALASGVSYVSGYPGCPSAEIGEGFLRIAKKEGIYAEWAVNEKTALESAIGASFSGLKSLVNMKSFGINVCSDSLLPLAYTGTKAPMVIVVADDPSCWSSAQSEQDSRGYAFLAKIPVLEPADPQECYDFTKLAFEVSEKFSVPVILRTTTRANHQRAIVNFEELPVTSYKLQAKFVKNPHQFSTMPPRTMEMKKELLEKLEKISAYLEKTKAIKIKKACLPAGRGKKLKIGIIASGPSYTHAFDAMQELGLDLPVMEMGVFYPLPEKSIVKFLKTLKTVLVTEETDPYLENAIKALAKDNDLKVKVLGQAEFGQIGEQNSSKIALALAKITGKKFKAPKAPDFSIGKRTARLCEGCPYWNVFPVIKNAVPKDTVIGGDIGCNMIAGLAPHSMHDYLFSMGASIGIGHGVSKALKEAASAEGSGVPRQKVVTIMGDGTFFHAGIQGLINAVYNKSNPVMVIVDNRITAMTGHQQNPGMGKTGTQDDTVEIKIEDVVKSLGVKHVKVLDPINRNELEATIKDFIAKDEVSVIICRQICALLARRQQKAKSN